MGHWVQRRKDSTATLQLVWNALETVPDGLRSKPVHVITTDTLVEQPIVSAWVGKSLEVMRLAADEKGLPIHANLLTPRVEDTFWVNLIGRGYPAPRRKFRWCTERMKIKPSNSFIRDVVDAHGQAILVLGTRKAESARRARTMTRHEKGRWRDRLSPNANLPNSMVYTPIEDWSDDDVWLYLMQVPNPWGYENKDLLTMYQGASADGECPLVVDTSTPSCGDSRFGCWVCTVVDKDRSMEAMIQNDEEKEWMLPLLELRNELDAEKNDRHLRDFRRSTGKVQLFGEDDRYIPGPYTQKSRSMWLQKVLEAQMWIRDNGPDQAKDIVLITEDELKEIRRIWLEEKNEFEDELPRIYEEVVGEPLAERPQRFAGFGSREVDLLRDACAGDELHYELVRSLLAVEHRYRSHARRAGLYEALEECFTRAYYEDEDDALSLAKRKRHALRLKDAIASGEDVT